MAPKFSEDIVWLEPFYRAAEDLIPARRLKEVRGYRVPISRWICGDAMCLQKEDNSCVIMLRIKGHRGRRGKAVAQQRETIENVLMNFAHELAHVAQNYGVGPGNWHRIEHWELSLRINRRFLRVLRRYGVSNMSARTCKKLGKKE